jgi:hypothetical protein
MDTIELFVICFMIGVVFAAAERLWWCRKRA